MTTRILPALVALVVSFTFAACDSGDPGGDLSAGSFSAQVSGAVSDSFAGTAASAGSNSSGGWGLVFGAPNAVSITLVTVSDRPSKGTYTIVNASQTSTLGDNEFVATVIFTGGVAAAYASTSGTVTISSSSASSVAGTFSFMADGGNSETITVSGSFNSLNVLAGRSDL